MGFAENFMLSGVAAAVSKTAAAPIERVKLLVQNQSEMLKQGILDKPYSGVVDCTTRTMKSEGLGAFWRGEMINNSVILTLKIDFILYGITLHIIIFIYTRNKKPQLIRNRSTM